MTRYSVPSADWCKLSSALDPGTILQADAEGRISPWDPRNPAARLAGVVTETGIHGFRTTASWIIADSSLRDAPTGSFVFCLSGQKPHGLSSQDRFSIDPSTSAAPPIGVVSEPGFVRTFSIGEAATVALAWETACLVGAR